MYYTVKCKHESEQLLCSVTLKTGKETMNLSEDHVNILVDYNYSKDRYICPCLHIKNCLDMPTQNFDILFKAHNINVVAFPLTSQKVRGQFGYYIQVVRTRTQVARTCSMSLACLNVLTKTHGDITYIDNQIKKKKSIEYEVPYSRNGIEINLFQGQSYVLFITWKMIRFSAGSSNLNMEFQKLSYN